MALMLGSAVIAQSQDLADDPASRLARKILRDSGVVADGLRLVHRESQTWSDSSLGCRQRGVMYTQALSQGLALQFTDARGVRKYEVHVAGQNAVICRMLRPPPGRQLRAAVSIRALQRMQELAREDLAQRLSLPASAVTLRSSMPASWPDDTLGCADGSSGTEGQIAGYRILLQTGAGQYVYHTDLLRVLICPPLLTQ